MCCQCHVLCPTSCSLRHTVLLQLHRGRCMPPIPAVHNPHVTTYAAFWPSRYVALRRWMHYGMGRPSKCCSACVPATAAVALCSLDLLHFIIPWSRDWTIMIINVICRKLVIGQQSHQPLLPCMPALSAAQTWGALWQTPTTTTPPTVSLTAPVWLRALP